MMKKKTGNSVGILTSMLSRFEFQRPNTISNIKEKASSVENFTLERIFCLLDVSDILYLSLVCKRFCIISNSNEIWKKKHEERFFYHNHHINPLISNKIFWKHVYRYCHFTETLGNNFVPNFTVSLPKYQNGSSFMGVFSTLASIGSRESEEGEPVTFTCNFQPLKIHVIILGWIGCGKSSLLARITRNIFDKEYIATIGAQFTKFHYFRKELIQFHIWDCSGQERYIGLCQRLMNTNNIAVLVYDPTNYDSLRTLKTWWGELSRNKLVVTCIVGTKSDVHERRISVEEIKQFAETEGISFFGEVSAKTTENVPNFIEYLYGLYQQNIRIFGNG